MKHIIIAAVITLCTLLSAEARRTPGDKAGVQFETLVYDFGTIRSDSKAATHNFDFTVTGNSAVAILQATPSCGCTASDFPRKPTRPGEKASIKVSFNPRGQKGEVEKDVRVKFRNGSGKSESLTLRIKGVVIPKD